MVVLVVCCSFVLLSLFLTHAISSLFASLSHTTAHYNNHPHTTHTQPHTTTLPLLPHYTHYHTNHTTHTTNHTTTGGRCSGHWLTLFGSDEPIENPKSSIDHDVSTLQRRHLHRYLYRRTYRVEIGRWPQHYGTLWLSLWLWLLSLWLWLLWLLWLWWLWWLWLLSLLSLLLCVYRVI